MIDFWHLQNVDWLRELSPEVADGLRSEAELTDYPQGALIFKPAIDPGYVYLLESGLVRIYRESEHAEQVTFGYVQPGEVFGECAVKGKFCRRSRTVYRAQVVAPAFHRRHTVETFDHVCRGQADRGPVQECRIPG